MDFKDGIKWPEDMHPSMWMARMVIDQLHREETERGAVITSAYRDQKPGGSSLHPQKRALDLRVWFLRDHDHEREFARKLRDRLGPDYDVVVEGPAAEYDQYKSRPPHIHVEYDPGKWA